ncbi:MAG TPA: mechanosensitive ion channel family protein [Candidatus Acidoferrales bacterium]|nr:mechanosensitive ion channel family protein [Candidatus Acidoferrales bacterium]
MSVMGFLRSPAAKRAGHFGEALAVSLALLGFGASAFAQNVPVRGPDPTQVVQFLNQTIAWYRQLPVQEQAATGPGDWMIVYNNRQTADRVVQLAFEFARAQADLMAKESGSSQAQSSGAESTQYQALRQWQATIDKQIKDTQAEMDADKQKLAAGTGNRKEMQATVSELQAELDLANARREALQGMLEFVGGADGSGASGLKQQVDALAGSVPAGLSSPAAAGRLRAAAPSPQLEGLPLPPAAASAPRTSGIWDMTARVFALSDKIHALDSEIQQTEALARSSVAVRAPLLDSLKKLSEQGDQLAKQADAANAATLAQEKQQLDSLAAQFKQVSATLLPLSKQGILLAGYSKNIASWREATHGEYRTALRALLVRLALLGLLLGAVIVAAELWRRAIYRYVRDTRRRYQFLLLRRFALWTLIAAIVALAFASRLGSVLTFAGLLTAGVAVALQNVILSVVGYFFLIGKFGIKVGDRVQIGGVSGEIIDIGLVRLHLMELRGPGVDIPTGRVVAFSNSVALQPAGLFKQIPGTNFVWHEITLTLSPVSDYSGIKTRLVGAVDTVLADYREEMERQNRRLETFGAATGSGLSPKSQLRFTPSGIEVVIRFPVDLQHAAEIDERISRELLNALDREPKLKLAAPAGGGIQLRTDLTASEAAGPAS